MEITFESVDDEMSKYNELEQENGTQEEYAMIRRSNRTSTKPSSLEDYDMGATAIQKVTMSEEITSLEELQESVVEELAGVGFGASFDYKQELHLISYNKVTESPYKDKWISH